MGELHLFQITMTSSSSLNVFIWLKLFIAEEAYLCVCLGIVVGDIAMYSYVACVHLELRYASWFHLLIRVLWCFIILLYKKNNIREILHVGGRLLREFFTWCKLQLYHYSKRTIRVCLHSLVTFYFFLFVLRGSGHSSFSEGWNYTLNGNAMLFKNVWFCNKTLLGKTHNCQLSLCVFKYFTIMLRIRVLFLPDLSF